MCRLVTCVHFPFSWVLQATSGHRYSRALLSKWWMGERLERGSGDYPRLSARAKQKERMCERRRKRERRERERVKDGHKLDEGTQVSIVGGLAARAGMAGNHPRHPCSPRARAPYANIMCMVVFAALEFRFVQRIRLQPFPDSQIFLLNSNILACTTLKAVVHGGK